MAQHQYIDQITEFSKKELKKILKTIKTPICLIGGWAVHLQASQLLRIDENLIKNSIKNLLKKP